MSDYIPPKLTEAQLDELDCPECAKLEQRIVELEQEVLDQFGELNRQELAIRDLRLRNQELRENG